VDYGTVGMRVGVLAPPLINRTRDNLYLHVLICKIGIILTLEKGSKIEFTNSLMHCLA